MQAKLIIAFDPLSITDFLAKTGAIIVAMTGNAHYPEPWAAQVPTLEQLNTALDAYRDAYHASLTRDTLKISSDTSLPTTLTFLTDFPVTKSFFVFGSIKFFSTR